MRRRVRRPATEKWPYVCPSGCPKRGWCGFPKCSYDAGDTDASYRETLSSSRSGICCTQEELDAMNAIVVPLAKQGQSLEAIWAEHAAELPACVRSAYKYQASGAIGLTSLDMTRKARLLPRRRPGAGGAKRERVDRTGRTYDDGLEHESISCKLQSLILFDLNESQTRTYAGCG